MALITLTSDFGLQDYIAGAVKGQLLQIDPDFRIHDISHQVAPFNYPQALISAGMQSGNFPANTYHIILVNLFEQKPEHLLLACYNGQYIFCADNGLINMILPARPEKVIGIPLDQKCKLKIPFIAPGRWARQSLATGSRAFTRKPWAIRKLNISKKMNSAHCLEKIILKDRSFLSTNSKM